MNRAFRPDQAQRKSIYGKLTKIILEELPNALSLSPRVLIAHTTRLEGYGRCPTASCA